MQNGSALVINPLGIHARPSARLTQLASRFRSEVWLSRNGRRVNGKSIMGVMMLAAAKGSVIQIETEGPDELDALVALQALFASGFDDLLS